MGLGDENADDEKEEKPKVYKSAIDAEDAAISRNSHRPTVAGEQDDVKQEKNDVCLEANVQPCPSTSASNCPTAGTSSSSSSSLSGDGSKDSANVASGASAVNGASPKIGNGKSSSSAGGGGSSATTSSAPDASRATAFRSTASTQSNRFNGLDAFMNGLSTANSNFYVGMPPGGLAYLAPGPSSGGSGQSTHGVLHPMASYAHNLPVLYQTAAHLMGNRFPGSPNAGSSPFQQPFAGLSPYYPTPPDGGQSAPSQAAAGPAAAAFPFALCGDPKSVGIRSPFGFFPAAGQCSPSFGPSPMLIQQSMLEQLQQQWYAAARYASPMFPLAMMTAANGGTGVTTGPGGLACSPNATLSPIINSSPIAGGPPTLTPSALAPPSLIPAYSAAAGHYAAAAAAAAGLRFPSPATSSAGANALAAMSQIPLPVVSTSVKSVATAGTASSASANSARHSLNQNGSASSIVNGHSSTKNRTSSHHDHHHARSRHHDDNGHHGGSSTSKSTSHEKALKKMTHIKKPLNAFMLYMKEMRPIVMQEVGLKERQSAEINRILGRRWHSLTRDEQQKYYDMARHERTLHMQRYPNWSARDNYALHKKKKRKRDKAQENLEMKKCRARFGLDQQSKWCKHCRRKKKCLWFREGAGGGGGASASSMASSSGMQEENGGDSSAEHSPPQVTSTTNGPDTIGSSSASSASSTSSSTTTVLAAETDVNSPQSHVTSTITIALGATGRPAPPPSALNSNNGGGGSMKKKASVSTIPKNGRPSGGQSPKKRRFTTGDSDDEDGGSSGDEDDGSTDGDEFDEDEIDDEAEAAAMARAAAEGADFDEEMAALISPPSSDGGNNGLVVAEDGHAS